ncbi:MAG: carboxypeptidase regulatory-like domain-containing protein, partial [Acidobacteriota bacterium]
MTNRGINLFFLLSVFLAPAAGLSQTLGGTIRGRIVDSAGAVRPDAQVAAINEETGEVRRTLTGSDGEFALSALAPGSYRLEAEMPGFRKHVEKGVGLQVGQDLRVNITMQPGGPAEEIIVEARKILVEPDTAGLGAVIGNRQIVSLPLDGRNFLLLSLLLPGTAPAAQGSPGSIRGKFAINVNGAREDANNFILDGAYNNDPKLNSFAINPPVDAIREFEILSSTYDATFGRSGGAQVNIVTKSGTNEFHGTAYHFFRNAALDARNFFARSEDPDPRYQRNQFGFSLGGPVRKNRTFIFADYEGRRMREGITQVTNVPTALERNGDFSQSNSGFPLDPYTQSAFDNGRIPAERVSPVGRAVADLYPVPNRAVPGQNYV